MFTLRSNANLQTTTQSARAAATATSPTTGPIEQAQAAALNHSEPATATARRSGREFDLETNALLAAQRRGHSTMAAQPESPLRNGGQASAANGGGDWGGDGEGDGATFVELDAGSRDQHESVVCT